MTEPRRLANFIGGEWVAPSTGQYADDINPADPKDVIARVPKAGADDVFAAVAAAKATFRDWKRMSPIRRGQILVAASRILESRQDELVEILTREQGKPLTEARGEVTRAIDFWSWMGHQGGSLQGITAPSEFDTIQVMTLREPIGVVSLITPWNFPVNIPGWKLASALVCGNTVVLKPSQLTPICAEFLFRCLADAGIPTGVVNLVFGGGREVGEPLVGHPDVAAISFTGSTETGLAINQKAALLGKQVQAEMGGHNAVIVMPDADLDKAAKGSAVAAFGTTGQRCTAARRVLAHEAIVEPLTEKLTELAGALKVGPGTKQGIDIGPLVEEGALTAVLEQVEIARNEGARVLTGGKRLRGELADGYFIEPTLLANVSPQMTIAKEEVFGPVLPIMPISGYDEAVEIATSTRYGLSSSIFTRDINLAFRFMHDTDTGVVHINKPPIGGESHLPFGGLKSSALGPKEMGAAMEFFTQSKTVYVDWS
jgi:aldehyde dehydrogenase (NAD+)